MNMSDFQEIRSIAVDLDREGRQALKESEIERMSYRGIDPLDILISLQSLNLFWY